MKAVEGFVRENRSTLSHNIKGLNRVSKVLVKQRAALDKVLRVAPTALANLFHTYNPSSGTLDTRTNISENLDRLTSDPRKFCAASSRLEVAGQRQTCSALQGLPLPKPRAGALTPPPKARPPGRRQVETVDRSLAGIVGGQR